VEPRSEPAVHAGPRRWQEEGDAGCTVARRGLEGLGERATARPLHRRDHRHSSVAEASNSRSEDADPDIESVGQ
jgi:hypothetical protein